MHIQCTHTEITLKHEVAHQCVVYELVTGIESSERYNLGDHLLKARGEEVCGVYLV